VAELNLELKLQANDIRISSNLIYNAKMKYNLFFFFFCLDDADRENKKMNNLNTEKLKEH
jgi:hypothetical protein